MSDIVVGISTFNSYFSSGNLTKMLTWSCTHYDYVHIFIMDGAGIYNLLALGYNQEEAARKTHKNDKELIARVNKVIKTCNITNCQIIKLSELSTTPEYKSLYDKYKLLFHQEGEFYHLCLNITNNILASKVDIITEEMKLIAVQYLLAELPVILHAPTVLNITNVINITMLHKPLSEDFLCLLHDYHLPENVNIIIKTF